MPIKLYKPFKEDLRISQGFGENYESYKWIKDVNGKSILGHNGTDFGYAGVNGIKLFNPFPKGDDVVVSHVSFDKDGYGWFMRVWDKTQNFVVLMAHGQEVLKKAWESVGFRENIMIGDNTGWSTGPHLHLAGYHVDEEGNKLNRGNGYDGFVDLMDKRITEWQEEVKDWREYFNFDITKRLADDLWEGLNFDEMEEFDRATALDNFHKSWNKLYDAAKKATNDLEDIAPEFEKIQKANKTLQTKLTKLDIDYNKLKAEKDIDPVRALEFLIDWIKKVVTRK